MKILRNIVVGLIVLFFICFISMLLSSSKGMIEVFFILSLLLLYLLVVALVISGVCFSVKFIRSIVVQRSKEKSNNV